MEGIMCLRQHQLENRSHKGKLNCTAPDSDDDQLYSLSSEKLAAGTVINHGKAIIAEMMCENGDEELDDHIVNFQPNEDGNPSQTKVHVQLTCTNGVIPDYDTLSCSAGTTDPQDINPNECKILPNGTVTDSGQSFECNHGYAYADSLLYERYSCSCNREIPAFVCSGKQAQSKPINCKLNGSIEHGLTVMYKGLIISATAIEAIVHGESAVFNCESGGNGETYEPKFRIFICDMGNWVVENGSGESWSLGNNGSFPECRPAKCECQNGGICIRDETCTCPIFSTGQQCETPLCPDGCQNGGTCTSPNKCSRPDGFSGNRCQTEEGCQAPIDKGNDAFYRNGAIYTVTRESCSGGNVPSFKGQITCTIYRIRVKTADYWGPGECTEGEVYLYMYGSKGDSGKIIVHGTFEPGDEDHTMGHFVDVRKISKIQLGVKARSLAGDGWIPESVLIIDVSRKEYYKFIHGAEIDDTSIFLYPLASCYPSKNLRGVFPIYFVGDELHLKPSNCAEGYEPQPSFTKCTQRGWTADVVCLS
ncbi:neurogenic locus notch homolog protein 1-like [Mya arenaria]|uniref:neurogenic locus notch homolog protein 1-like n=1 Tax=Mya arenaria TaxID=6604 RepID=UPI0022E0BEDB|nr:neurogenic locus notch homolog protein 1-like [Mya arenaria]